MTAETLQKMFDVTSGLDFDVTRAWWLGRMSESVYPATEEEDAAARQVKAARARRRSSLLASFGLSHSADNATENTGAVERLQDLTRDLARVEAGRLKHDFHALGFDQVQLLSGLGTQCVVAWSGETVVLCFRGTEPDRLLDIYADLLALPVGAFGIAGRLHAGFWQALREVWGDPGMPPLLWPDIAGETGLPEVLRSITSRGQAPQVWICGHSLGGALATLAAARLVADGVLHEDDICGVYTFGQPRVGDDDFVAQYPLSARHFRLVNRNDIVTRVPPAGLGLVEKAASLVLEDTARVGWLSRLSYRHVGQMIFLTGDADPLLKPALPVLVIQRLRARLKAFRSPGGMVQRFFSGLGDHSMSTYNHSLQLIATRDTARPNKNEEILENEAISTSETPIDTAAPASLWVSIFSSAGAGLLMGYLIGMSISPVVGLLVGALATGLAALLGLNDRHFTRAKGIRIGTFCFAAIIAALAGTYTRTHDLLAPKVEARTLAQVQKEYLALGLDESTVKGLMANYINAQNKVSVVLAQNETAQKARTSAHFSGGVALSTCGQLKTPFDDELSAEQAIASFKLEGGTGWAAFATSVEGAMARDDSKKVLFIARDAVCARGGALKLTPATCTQLLGGNQIPSARYKVLLKDVDGMAPLLERTDALSSEEQKTAALGLLTGLLCASPK